MRGSAGVAPQLGRDIGRLIAKDPSLVRCHFHGRKPLYFSVRGESSRNRPISEQQRRKMTLTKTAMKIAILQFRQFVKQPDLALPSALAPRNWRRCGWPSLAAGLLILFGALGGSHAGDPRRAGGNNPVPTHPRPPNAFARTKAGDEIRFNDINLCWCPPGKFIMGSPPSEPDRRPGEDQVEVTLTQGFWTAKFETTQGQWRQVMGPLPGPLTAELPEGDDYPVGNVNFAEAEAFCRKLTELGRQSGRLPKAWEFRLPTEAQWEYACRAGTTTATAFGDKLSSRQANFKGKPYNGGEPGPSLGHASKVGSYPANAWGLHDMHGNIFEWCRDWYQAKLPGGLDPDLHTAETTAETNRTGDKSRSRRGGAWTDDGWPCRSAFRLRFEPERRYDHIGFRVVLVQEGRQ